MQDELRNANHKTNNSGECYCVYATRRELERVQRETESALGAVTGSGHGEPRADLDSSSVTPARLEDHFRFRVFVSRPLSSSLGGQWARAEHLRRVTQLYHSETLVVSAQAMLTRYVT